MKNHIVFLLTVMTAAQPSFAASAGSSSVISPEKREALRLLRDQIRGWAMECADGSLTNTVTEAECPYGDMTIFAGLACLAGEKKRCDDVRRAQSVTGEWFRAPGYVDRQRADGGPSFSRDQSRGALAYLVATEDREAAVRWLDFIEKNGFKLCQESEKNWPACDIRVSSWPNFTVVWDYLGLKRGKKMKNWKQVAQKFYNPIAAATQPNNFPLHLTASSIFIRQEIEKRTGVQDPFRGNMKLVTKVLTLRAPENPFFNYLHHGPNERAADLVLKHCPSKAPKNSRYRDWIWQREKNNLFERTGEKNWDHPGGHECIFMVNLLVGADH